MKKLIICLCAGMFVTGCWAKKPSCEVIKAANDVCTMIEYVDSDGNVHQVKVDKEQLDSLARDSATRDGKPAPKAKPEKE